MKLDTLYPIYDVSVSWTYLDEKGERSGNSTIHHRMYREDPGEKGVLADMRAWWKDYDKKGLEPSEPEFKLRRYEESWCVTWFGHYTLDVGQTDAEALATFRRYVSRYAHMQGDLRAWETYPDFICLMGAEDTWRWRSGSEDYEGIPCRCEHCKRQGVLRIAH